MRLPFVFISVVYILCGSRCNRDVLEGRIQLCADMGNLGEFNVQFVKTDVLLYAAEKLWIRTEAMKDIPTCERSCITYFSCVRNKKRRRDIGIYKPQLTLCEGKV